jgi:hypothetical protein
VKWEKTRVQQETNVMKTGKRSNYRDIKKDG